MTALRAKFKSFVHASAFAAAFGCMVMAAPSAFAQNDPAIQFQLQLPGAPAQQNDGIARQVPNAPAQQMPNGQAQQRGNGFGYPDYGYDYGYDDWNWGYRCLTDWEVVQGIADYGYRRVQISRYFRNERVEVIAQYGNWYYSMRVDKCTGEVDRVQRMRRANGGGFGFDFQFGN